MLRALSAVAAAALVLAGCGDDDDGAPAPPAEPQLGGTVLGQPFTSVDGGALVLTPGRCAFGSFQAVSTGLLLGFGDFGGVCNLVTTTQGCGVKANATVVTAVVVRANAVGGTAPPIGPGTYQVTSTSAAPDAQGNVSFVQAVVARTNATCGDTSGNPVATGGSVRIDSVDASRVTGFADLTFEGSGGRVSGAFSVSRCGLEPDVCTVLSGGSCTGEVCVP